MASSKHIGKVAVMDLLDDYWFFHSTLFTKKQPPSSVDASSTSPVEIKATKQRDSAMASSFLNQELINLPSSSTPQLELPSSQQHKSSEATPALLIRMPTLPVPRLREDQTALPFNSCYTKLRHSMSALDTYQSTTTTSSSSTAASKNNACTDLSSGAGDRPPRHMIKLEKTDRYTSIRHFIAREAYYRKTFKEKKWRSVGDLDYIEIQGLKDLGFVLDKELQGQMNASSWSFTARSSSTVPVILNSQTTARAPPNDAKVVMRPYLSQRSAPPMFRWVNRKSADDMKDQLRFWARAVASNTKLEGF